MELQSRNLGEADPESRSDVGDVGGQERDPVPVKVVAAGTAVALGRARVGLPGQDLSVSERHACVEGVGDGGVRRGVRLMWRGIPATSRYW